MQREDFINKVTYGVFIVCIHATVEPRHKILFYNIISAVYYIDGPKFVATCS